MTLGQMCECLLVRTNQIRKGDRITILPFGGTVAGNAQNETNPSMDCLETMYDPRTGNAYPTKIFCGINYYHRLKHMVGSKVRVRGSDGRSDPLTGQAVHGRKQYGGLRVGEMEMLVLVAQSAHSLLRDLFLTSGDGISATLCTKCSRWDYGSPGRGTDGFRKNPSEPPEIITRPFCDGTVCRSGTVTRIAVDHSKYHRRYRQVSRAFLRMWEELMAIGVQMELPPNAAKNETFALPIMRRCGETVDGGSSI